MKALHAIERARAACELHAVRPVLELVVAYAASDGLYHFNIDFTVDEENGEDDSIGVGFKIANNSYYNQTVGTTSPFRINPQFDSRSGIEHSYSFGKTARLSQGATIGFYITVWNATNTILQGAHFSGFKT